VTRQQTIGPELFGTAEAGFATKTNVPFLKDTEFHYGWLAFWSEDYRGVWAKVIYVLMAVFIVTAVKAVGDRSEDKENARDQVPHRLPQKEEPHDDGNEQDAEERQLVGRVVKMELAMRVTRFVVQMEFLNEGFRSD